MNYLNQSATYNVTLYTDVDILHGEITCPSNIRLLDLFNRTGNAKSDFLEFVDEEKAEPDRQTSYIRIDSVLVLSVSEPNEGRGVGANENYRSFPFVPKTARSVIIQMQKYQIHGFMHLCQGQTSQDLLNGDKQFLPLTEAVIGNTQNEFSSSPFVIVNKNYLMRLWDHQTGIVPEPVLV